MNDDFYDDITQYFIYIIDQAHGYDMADSDFKRALADDDRLRAAYREWCRQNGTSEKNGFLDFCEEYMADRNQMWDSLNDYDDDSNDSPSF